MSRRTLVLGIGNPILGDDAIGILVAKEIAAMNIPGVEVAEISASGIEVMEIMLDYDRVIIVDAIMLPGHEPGEVMRLNEEDFSSSVHGTSPHGVNLSTAIALGRRLAPERMPGEILFFAMQASEVNHFREGVSDSVRARLPEFVSLVVQAIEGR